MGRFRRLVLTVAVYAFAGAQMASGATADSTARREEGSKMSDAGSPMLPDYIRRIAEGYYEERDRRLEGIATPEASAWTASAAIRPVTARNAEMTAAAGTVGRAAPSPAVPPTGPANASTTNATTVAAHPGTFAPR